jgi:RNA polymerase sigma-70 factor (ECF subfamily)
MRQVSTIGAGDFARPVPRASRPAGSAEFADFYRSELPGLVALARGLCGSAVADDIAQEAMLAVYRRWDEVERFDEPRAWVRRTCANLAISVFRRRVVELRALTRLAADRPPERPLDEESEAFWTAVRSLPRRQAQCAALRYLYGMSGAEIARTLDVSENSVKVHLARGRRALAARLGADEEDRP